MKSSAAASAAGFWPLFPARILSFYREAQALQAGKFPPPRMVVLHLNYLCNHACVGCDFRRENRELHHNPDPRTLDRLAAAVIATGAEAVELSGGGEPLLAPGIERLIRRFRKAGLAVGLLTNGSALRGSVLETVIRHCAYVRISLEAGSPAVFARVKGVADPGEFRRIVANIRAAVALKRRLRSAIKINLKYTVGTINRGDLAPAARLAARLGVDSLQVRPYENCPITFPDPEPVERELVRLRARWRGKLPIIGSVRFPRSTRRCWLTPLITTVDSFGDVFLCPYYRHRRDRHRVGNLLRQPWSKLWGSATHRRRLGGIRPAECNRYACRFHRYNEILREFLAHDQLAFI